MKKLYSISSKRFQLLTNYLLVNQNEFPIERIIPKYSFDEIILDVYEDTLAKIKELVLPLHMENDILKGMISKKYPGNLLLKELTEVLESTAQCPVCKRISSKPLVSAYIKEKDDPMYLEEIFVCDICKTLSSSGIHKIIDATNSKDEFYKCLEEEKGLLFKLYEKNKKFL